METACVGNKSVLSGGREGSLQFSRNILITIAVIKF